MAEYTLSLQSTADYRMIKKLLKAFDGAKITPVHSREGSLKRSLEEAKSGKVAGPFDSVDHLMTDLLS